MKGIANQKGKKYQSQLECCVHYLCPNPLCHKQGNSPKESSTVISERKAAWIYLVSVIFSFRAIYI